MLQVPIFEREIIATSTNQIYEFLSDKELIDIDIDILAEDKVLVNGKSLKENDNENENDYINKPSQFGSFVLSHSRDIKLCCSSIIHNSIQLSVISQFHILIPTAVTFQVICVAK